MGVFVIAEAGSSHDNDLSKAYRLIEAAKECGADAVKFQYWSSSKALATRRGIPDAEAKYESCRISKEFVDNLYTHCTERVKIEFMCSTFLIEDIPFIAQYVKRFKVSAFEGRWTEFVDAHLPYSKQIIISNGMSSRTAYPGFIKNPCDIKNLVCVSKYPAALEDYDLKLLWPNEMGSNDGLSDHTTSLLTGALSVAAGGSIVEKHIRLHDTDKANPDYGHSLIADAQDDDPPGHSNFGAYVEYIREAEKAL